MPSGKIFSPRDHSFKQTEGKIQRYNWRTRARLGPGHDKMSGKEIKKTMRKVSWRRAH